MVKEYYSIDRFGRKYTFKNKRQAAAYLALQKNRGILINKKWFKKFNLHKFRKLR